MTKKAVYPTDHNKLIRLGKRLQNECTKKQCVCDLPHTAEVPEALPLVAVEFPLHPAR
ncbi:hypothetical protein JQC72_03990 [Polycladomyces sp. WAk]|uniref:Uncharacterized protein n=1 Tax=Polycladomyces zharkentensis TaxID=2807616 RepID=A0ABS2WGJ8_9BACL|nr:hypothetical protein [Polycladomyces sp. WAk]MBN2908680.1 hypothetical protein [Polycladomyces sp. WAk]